jgi:hypothetical protein
MLSASPAEAVVRAGDDRSHVYRFVIPLTTGEADHLVPGVLVHDVSPVVSLDRPPIRVEVVAIYLDDQAHLGPTEVRVETRHRIVRAGLRETGGSNQP